MEEKKKKKRKRSLENEEILKAEPTKVKPVKSILKKTKKEVPQSVEDALDPESVVPPPDATTPRTKSEKMRLKRNERKKEKSTPTAPAVDDAGQRLRVVEAKAYLRLWRGEKTAWKFNKLRQTWLLKNALDAEAVDDETFDILLDYVRPLKGKARRATVESAVKKVNESDVEPSVAERARVLVQALS